MPGSKLACYPPLVINDLGYEKTSIYYNVFIPAFLGG